MSNPIVSLPVDIRCHVNKLGEFDYRSILQLQGIVFLNSKTPCLHNEFVNLPKGWSFVCAEDVLTYLLLDQRGRKRASIRRYPLTPYMEIFTKFDVMTKTLNLNSHSYCVAEVFESEKVVKSFSVECSRENDFMARFELKEQVRQTAMDWLDQNYRDWRNPGAYWND